MLLFGKILAILNVIAVLVFGYFAMETYTKRQAWTRAVFETNLQRTGLPVDETQIDDEGTVIAEQIAPTMLPSTLKDTPTVSKAGEALLARVKGLQDLNNAQNRIQVLLPLLRTAHERSQYQKLFAFQAGLIKREDLKDTELTELDQLRTGLQDELEKRLQQFKQTKAGPQDPKGVRREVALLYATFL